MDNPWSNLPGAPQITPGQGGYLAAPPAFNPGTNPFQGSVDQGQAQLTQDTGATGWMSAAAQTNLSGLSAQQAQYPSFPNAGGFGTQQGYQPMPTDQGGAGPAQVPTTQPAFDATSRGFNPWSLQGEALSRGQ